MGIATAIVTVATRTMIKTKEFGIGSLTKWRKYGIKLLEMIEL
jgi:hypothetical protein